MANTESTGFVQETYLNMNRKDVQEQLNEDKFYNYFYNLLENGSNYCQFTNAKLVKSIDPEWVEAIEEAIPSLHYAVTNPRKFIEEEREVVNVAMARNITTESVRHLLQHSDLIDEYREDGTVIPNRILNIFKEESINIYENRFICTLIAELQYFINKRFNVIFEVSKDEIETFFELQSRIDNYTEVVEYNLTVKIKEKQTDVNNEGENNNIFARIIKIHQQINMLAATEFVSMMKRYPAVMHPIIKTNVIGKNKDYIACHKLWNFIHNYDRVGYKVNIVKREPVISREFERDIYNTLIRDYAVLHHNMELTNEIDITRPPKEKEMGVKQIRQLLDEIVRSTNLGDAALKKLIANELADLQAKRKQELAELERVNRQKIREIRKNQVRQGEGRIALEEIEGETSPSLSKRLLRKRKKDKALKLKSNK